MYMLCLVTMMMSIKRPHKPRTETNPEQKATKLQQPQYKSEQKTISPKTSPTAMVHRISKQIERNMVWAGGSINFVMSGVVSYDCISQIKSARWLAPSMIQKICRIQGTAASRTGRGHRSSSISPRAAVLIRDLALALDHALVAVVPLTAIVVARVRVRVRVDAVLALVLVLVAASSAGPLDLVEALLAGAADGVGELHELENILL